MSDAVIEEIPLPSFEEVLSALETGEPISELPETEEEAPEEAEASEAEVEEEEPEAAAEEEEPEAHAAPPQPPAPDPDVAARLERVAAAERELSVRRREADAYQAQIAEREAQIAAQLKRLEEADAWFRSLEEGDPLAALEARGISFDQLAQGVATGQGVRPNKQLEDRLAKQERELREFREAQQQAQAAQVRQQRELAARQEIAAEVERRSPMLAAMGEEGRELLWNLAHAHKQSTGEVPTYDTLFDQAHERLFNFLDRIKSVEAVRERFLSVDSKQSPKRAVSKTVSNRTAAQPAKQKKDVVDILELSEEQQFDALFGNGIPEAAE